MSGLKLYLTSGSRNGIIDVPNKQNKPNVPVFLQTRVITSSNDRETETRLNLWLARLEYKQITNIQFTALPAGGEVEMFTAVVFYYPNEYDAKIRHQQAKQMPPDAQLTTIKDVLT